MGAGPKPDMYTTQATNHENIDLDAAQIIEDFVI